MKSGYVAPDALAKAEGYDNAIDWLEETGIGYDSVVPACCERGCEVEPDGICPHGHSSVLIALGIM